MPIAPDGTKRGEAQQRESPPQQTRAAMSSFRHRAEEHCTSSTKVPFLRNGGKDLSMTLPQPNEPIAGSTHSLDGVGAGDHDQPYRFGGRPSAGVPFPFSTRQYARLLIIRSRHQATEVTAAEAA